MHPCVYMCLCVSICVSMCVVHECTCPCLGHLCVPVSVYIHVCAYVHLCVIHASVCLCACASICHPCVPAYIHLCVPVSVCICHPCVPVGGLCFCTRCSLVYSCCLEWGSQPSSSLAWAPQNNCRQTTHWSLGRQRDPEFHFCSAGTYWAICSSSPTAEAS